MPNSPKSKFSLSDLPKSFVREDSAPTPEQIQQALRSQIDQVVNQLTHQVREHANVLWHLTFGNPNIHAKDAFTMLDDMGANVVLCYEECRDFVKKISPKSAESMKPMPPEGYSLELVTEDQKPTGHVNVEMVSKVPFAPPVAKPLTADAVATLPQKKAR
jgi:hypothetical protein